MSLDFRTATHSSYEFITMYVFRVRNLCGVTYAHISFDDLTFLMMAFTLIDNCERDATFVRAIEGAVDHILKQIRKVRYDAGET